jgi:hypothetical protein
VLVIQVGTAIGFPNDDPFFHNVFSLFQGKRFDPGLYEAGTTRTVRFDRPGVSYIFCNIRPEMSAVILAVETPYFAVSAKTGHISIHGVPPGRYRVRVWAERCLSEDLDPLARDVSITGSSSSLGSIQVRESGNLIAAHKNKYGRDYVPPSELPYEKR